jgi:glycosyltransferase involved in cell wall biosynthesis
MHHERGFQRPIEDVPYFIPQIEEAPAPEKQSPHPRPYFLFVGRLEKIKGVETLFPIFRNYPHADLLIAGTGTYEAELRQRAAGIPNVVFLGALPQAKLRALYRHAIAVIVPSICYEVFGIILLEAFMQQTPVIARALGGLEEVVEESKGGFTYRSPDELLAAMERLRTDAALRREMGERGYQKYRERWDEEAHLRIYFRVLEDTARRKFGGVPWEGFRRATLEFTATSIQA